MCKEQHSTACLKCWVFILPFFVLLIAQSAEVSHPEDQTAENILSSVKPEEVKTIVRKVADQVLGNFKVGVSSGVAVQACKHSVFIYEDKF